MRIDPAGLRFSVAFGLGVCLVASGCSSMSAEKDGGIRADVAMSADVSPGDAGASGGSGGVAGAAGMGGTGTLDAGGDRSTDVPEQETDKPLVDASGGGNGASCPSSVPTTGSFCTSAALGVMCTFGRDADSTSCKCSAGDLITIWKCSGSP